LGHSMDSRVTWVGGLHLLLHSAGRREDMFIGLPWIMSIGHTVRQEYWPTSISRWLWN
jgi:hypothetical protein